jgi:tRNA-splicing ligase RtcB
MKIISGNKIITKSWANEIEESALEQINNVANLPFVYHHVALMPDVHKGMGCTIGSVVPCENAIVPNLVGVDVGCGMCAVKVDNKLPTINQIKIILGQIRNEIPVGMNRNKVIDQKYNNLYDKILNETCDYQANICRQEEHNALQSLCSLGGGNHFLELQKDIDNNLWVMIHSGSRNLGKKVCDYYNNEAKILNSQWYSNVDPKWNLAFLPTDSIIGQNYINEMKVCVEYALLNRKLMLEKVINIINTVLNIDTNLDNMINIAHNYARLEHHFGKNIWVHRKGATSAKLDEVGIIPGSMGTCSYIVRGLGNPDSFQSCSHGAGRKLGRKAAQKTLNLADEIKILDDQGIVHGIRHESDLDEASGAYKDISCVMSEQADLVEPITQLWPIGVVKG